LRCIEPAVASGRAHVTTDTEVTAVRTRGRRVTGLTLKRGRHRYRVAADLVILAAGAVGTPVFLIQHGLTGGNRNIGRHFMFHLGVIFTALRAGPTGSGRTFTKQLGLTDFYYGRGGGIHKLGYIQQLPIPGVMTMAEHLPVALPRHLLGKALERSITFAGAIEDLPRPSNRVGLAGGGIAIRHRYHPYDLYRARLMRRAFGPVMRRIPGSIAFSMTAGDEKLHTAHQVGTCRFGCDPHSSVLDRDCRLHHMDNLYVADGSFMPTALGVAPALTIMANALRIAAKLS
jgi:choline dehydrogenase-like flavoprotein